MTYSFELYRPAHVRSCDETTVLREIQCPDSNGKNSHQAVAAFAQFSTECQNRSLGGAHNDAETQLSFRARSHPKIFAYRSKATDLLILSVDHLNQLLKNPRTPRSKLLCVLLGIKSRLDMSMVFPSKRRAHWWIRCPPTNSRGGVRVRFRFPLTVAAC